MRNYRIFETNEFIKRVEKIPSKDKLFIEKKLALHIYPQLKEEPYFGNNIKNLTDYKPDTWRYRIGKYRLFYAVDEKEKTIFLLSIDLRKDVY